MKKIAVLCLATALAAAAANTTFRDERISLNGTWKFDLRRDNQLTGSGPVRFGPVSASSQAVLISPWPGETSEGRWHTSVPWAVSATILDSAPASLASQQIWKPHPKQQGPTWWRLDVGQRRSLGAVRIQWVKPGQIEVAVDTSEDGESWSPWTKAVSRAGDTETMLSAPPVQAQHVRLTFSPAQFDGTRKIDVLLAGRDGRLSPFEPRTQRVWYEELRKFTPADGFQLASFDDARWRMIEVPGYWEVQRFSEPTWWQPDETVGYYRRTFQVPQNWQGRHIRLRFEGVNNGAQVWINGQEIGYHESGFTPFEYDVTPHLRFGAENLIAVRVSKWTLTHDYDTDDVWFLGGIWRDVYLYSLPASRIDDYRLSTEFDSRYADSVLRVRASLRSGDPLRPQACTVEGTLYDGAGKPVPLDGLRAQLMLAGSGPQPVELAALVKTPKKWTAETPQLYSLVLRLNVDGRNVHEVRTTFGFRQVEVKGAAILLNGVPLKLRGVVTTRANPNDAGESWEQIFAREIRLLKEGNINAIRSHTTPLEEDFLDLCDRHGIYVIPDVPDVWVNEHDFRYLTEGNVQRAQEIFEQHKNRTSVIAWHIGNENGLSSAYRGMGRAAVWLHEADQARPVMICSNRADPVEFGTEVHDLHYYPMRNPEFQKPTAAPVLYGEFHALPEEIARLKDSGFVETWGRSLKLEWSEFEKRDWVSGGLICCWDDGSVNGNLGPRQWGVVDSRRHAKPVHAHIRKVFAPVRLVLEPPGTVVVTNHYNFTDLEGYRFAWKLLKAGKEIRSGTANWRVKPRAGGRFPLDVSGADTLKVAVADAEGYSVQSETISLPVTASPASIDQLLSTAGAARGGPIKAAPKEVRTRTYSARLADPGRLQITDATGGELVSIEGMVLQHGQSRGANRPIGEVQYSAASEWKVPFSIPGKAAGEMRFEFGPAWLRLSYELRAADALALREAGVRIRPAPRLSHMAWNRESLWTAPDGPLGDAAVADFARSISRRNVLWVYWAGGRGASLLAAPAEKLTNVRVDGDVFVLADFLGAGDFLGKFDRDTVERQIKKGETLSGGFTLHFLNSRQTEAFESLPAHQKDLTWARRAR
jgi:beta-galactosidase/beta-glucuronidase